MNINKKTNFHKLKNLWSYRFFIISSIRSEFEKKYAGSKFGLLWSILNPLFQSAIYALVLSKIMAAKLPGIPGNFGFSIYIMSGMAAWSLFSEIINRLIYVFVEYGGLMKKIAFPRICLPIISTGSALLNHLFLLFSIIIILLIMGIYPSVSWIALLIGIFYILFFSFSLGIILGVFYVFNRNIGQIMNVIMQMLFWMAPIAYLIDILPTRLSYIVEYNPLSMLIGIYHGAIVYNSFPSLRVLGLLTIISIAIFMLFIIIFLKAGEDLVDEL